MLTHLPRLVMLIDLQGTIIYWNRAGEKIFGYTAGEVVGKPVWLLYPHRDKNDLLTDLEYLKKGAILSVELEGRHKNGSTVWVDVRRTVMKMRNGQTVILGSASDISAQIKTRQDLALSEARVQAVLETAATGIITADRNGTIESFNKAAEQIFRYQSEEVIGENVRLLMPPSYGKEHGRYIQHYLETGERKIIGIRREVCGRRKDGSEFPMELAVSEVRFNEEIIFTGMVRDISERRRLESEILEISEEEKQRIGRDLHDGLGQMLIGIGLISRNLARKLKADNLPGAEEVYEISEMIREADEQARTLAYGLVNIELESEGFSDALKHLCERSKRLFKINCELNLDRCLLCENKVTASHVYRIIQEAISNAVKHGKAHRVKVRLQKSGKYVQLEVEDNGTGFSMPKNKEKFGIGMNTMSYRARILGGHLEVKETAEGDTLLICSIPDHQFEKKQREK